MSGIASRVASATICWRRLVKNGSPPTRSAPARRCRKVAKAVLISLGVLALRISSCRPSVREASCGVAYRARGFRKLRVHQQGDGSSIWNKFLQQPQAFSAQHGTEKADPCDVSARPVEACDETGSDRVATEREDDRYRGCRRLGRQNRVAASGRGDHRHLAGDQIGRKCRQSILLVFGKAVFDRHVTAFDIAGFTQATAERTARLGRSFRPRLVRNPTTGIAGCCARAASGHAAAARRAA